MANPTAEAKENAIGYARYAYDYIEAARKIDETIGQQPGYARVSPILAYNLAMHGIELTLKAFLRYHGIEPQALRGRKYGHDLHACFRKAKELGLLEIFKMTESDEKAMKLLVALNVDQGLRYVRKGWKEFPSWAIVNPLAARLHQAVAPVVGYEKTFNVHFAGHYLRIDLNDQGSNWQIQRWLPFAPAEVRVSAPRCKVVLGQAMSQYPARIEVLTQ